MVAVSISIDVPNLADGIRFYGNGLGFRKTAEPASGVVVLRAGNLEICLLEKAAGTTPSPETTEKRRYARHWTPIHLDFHVDNLKAALAKVLKAGAKKELLFENSEHGSAAFCSDPFGHGFCILERKAQQ